MPETKEPGRDERLAEISRLINEHLAIHEKEMHDGEVCPVERLTIVAWLADGLGVNSDEGWKAARMLGLALCIEKAKRQAEMN